MLFGSGNKNQILPDLTLAEVWQTFSKKSLIKSDKHHQLVYQKLQFFDSDARDGIFNELQQIETASMRHNDRLRYVREKIMDLVDRRTAANNLCRLTNLNKDEGPDDDDVSNTRLKLALADCDIQIAMLRYYTRGKYGDEGPDDWFCMYSYLSDFFCDQMATDEAANPVNHFFFEGQTLEPTKENFQMCRNKCLDANVGQQFEIPADKLTRLFKFFRNFNRKAIWRKLIS